MSGSSILKQFTWCDLRHMIGLKLLLAITQAACLFNLFTVLAAASGPLPLLHLLSSLNLVGQVVKAAKIMHWYCSLICSVTAGCGTLAKVHSAPGPLQHTTGVTLDGKYSLGQFVNLVKIFVLYKVIEFVSQVLVHSF